MKNILLCTTLLVAGLAGNVFVYGQVRREDAVIKVPLTQVLRTNPIPVIPLPGCQSLSNGSFSSLGYIWVVPTRGIVNGGDSVWIMEPDRMPCVVFSLAGTEPMPVKKLDSKRVSPMPNGVPDGRPHVHVVPRKEE